MMHRYLQPTWWVKRLFPSAERLFPPPWLMPALAWAVRRGDEPELDLLQKLVPADRLAVDVGAADGVYTWSLSRLAAACIAFEPNPKSAERVRARVPRAIVHAVALSDASGQTDLRVPVVGRSRYMGWATIEPGNAFTALAPDAVERLSVPMRTLDSFALRDVGFIKIDVEGHELAVLRGATETIRRCQPNIMIEVEDRHRADAGAEVAAWFQQAGYAPACGKSRSVGDVRTFARRQRNLVFYPRDADPCSSTAAASAKGTSGTGRHTL